MDDSSGMDNLSDEDAAVNGFFDRADEVAKLSLEEQEAWLARVAEAARGMPDLALALMQLITVLKLAGNQQRIPSDSECSFRTHGIPS